MFLHLDHLLFPPFPDTRSCLTLPYIVDELLMAKVFAQNGFRFVLCVCVCVYVCSSVCVCVCIFVEWIGVEVRTVNEINIGRWMAGKGALIVLEWIWWTNLLTAAYILHDVYAFGNRNFSLVNDRITSEIDSTVSGRYLLFCHRQCLSMYSCSSDGWTRRTVWWYYHPVRGLFEGRLRVSWRLIDSVLGRTERRKHFGKIMVSMNSIMNTWGIIMVGEN